MTDGFLPTDHSGKAKMNNLETFDESQSLRRVIQELKSRLHFKQTALCESEKQVARLLLHIREREGYSFDITAFRSQPLVKPRLGEDIILDTTPKVEAPPTSTAHVLVEVENKLKAVQLECEMTKEALQKALTENKLMEKKISELEADLNTINGDAKEGGSIIETRLSLAWLGTLALLMEKENSQKENLQDENSMTTFFQRFLGRFFSGPRPEGAAKRKDSLSAGESTAFKPLPHFVASTEMHVEGLTYERVNFEGKRKN